MEHVVAGRQAAPSWHTASASDREGFVTVLLERLEALHTPPKEMEPSQVLLALLHVAMKDTMGQERGPAGHVLPPLPAHSGVRLLLAQGLRSRHLIPHRGLTHVFGALDRAALLRA